LKFFFFFFKSRFFFPLSFSFFFFSFLPAAVFFPKTPTTTITLSPSFSSLKTPPLQEMGATLVYFPASHTKLLSLIKERVVAGRPPTVFPVANVKTGVLSNADKLCACIDPSSGPGSYTDNFERLFPTIAATFNAPAIRALFSAADFVGISNYPRLPSPEVSPADFEAGIKTFARELALFGVDLKDLVTTKGKQLWFSEVGIGGGANKGGWSRTLEPDIASANTFFGVATAYRADLDPWHAGGEQGAAMLRLLRKFYRALSVYVSSAGSCPGCTLG